MSSHLERFQESSSAGDLDGDIEFAAVEPEPTSEAANSLEEAAHAKRVCSERSSAVSAPIGDFGSQINQPLVAPAIDAPNWFKPKNNSLDVEAPPKLVEPPPLPSRKSKSKTRSKDRNGAAAKNSDSKRKPSAADSKPGAIPIDAELEEEAEPVAWHRHVFLWLMSAAAGGYGISLLFHFIVLIALSLVIYSTMDENEAISMTLTNTDGIVTDLDEMVMLETAPSGGAEQFAELRPVDLDQSPQTEAAIDIPSILGSGDGDTGGDDDGFAFKMPTGGRVSKKGSFAAWTVPKDPKPGQDYQIVIRIKLPKSSRKYRVDDLSGMVIGTDGYRLAIPFDRDKPGKTKAEKNGKLLPVEPGDYLRIVNSHVQLVVDVPGAASLVKDTIEVRSKKLKEDQKLEIEF
jgi:hypothetical protein